MSQLVSQLPVHHPRPAIVTTDGTWTYRDLDDASARAAAALVSGVRPGSDQGQTGVRPWSDPRLTPPRIALLAPPGFEFIATLIGIWRAGGVAVPLAVSHPPAEMEHVIRDSGASAVATTLAFAHVSAPLAAEAGAKLLTTTQLLAPGSENPEPVALPDVASHRPAYMLYTSGTTGKPKGVVITHGNLDAQIASLTKAWEWTKDDRTLLVLPLHHVHGLVNVVSCAIASGATCEVLPRFDADAVWARLASGDISVFTAVPTVYHRLIDAWQQSPADVRRRRSEGARRVRLMMSGSAALPVPTLERWREITGHTLLERYGMTEIGMALANPLHGERRPGHVGQPLPGVDVRLVDESGMPLGEGVEGEIEVRGATVFHEYWQRPDDTRAAFHDDWFRTGDVAVIDRGSYRILGRRSVDIIKTGGYKISALEIEDVLRAHPAIAECAVVGVGDPKWGERVCAAVELASGRTLVLGELQTWLESRLAPYKIPKALKCVPSLPRNSMGKVVKPDIARWFLQSGH
jgi:malonyl-CoA/methylmalonyl-CoA synthetase